MGVDPDRGPVDLARLRRLLGGPDTRWLLHRLRDRIERGDGLDGSAALRSPTPDERAALERLLGRPPGRGGQLTVRLADVETLLVRGGIAPDLTTAVTALTGPLRDRPGDRAALAAAWEAAYRVIDPLVRARPELTDWRERLRGGLLRRLAGDPGAAQGLLTDAAAVVDGLPTADEPLPALAARLLADAHALDDERPVTTVVLAAAAVLGGVPPGSGAPWRRKVWAAVGVLVGELSAPVLVLGLPGDAGTATGRVLGEWAAAGQPVHLSLRQLTRDPPRLPLAGRTASICENPTVVAAAADGLGVDCPPLICAGGQPSGAVRALLRLLAEDGALLRYHGDFDWGGITVANGLLRDHRIAPWRYDATAYRAAVANGSGRALTGRPTAASWDAELAPAMRTAGARVEEEQVLPRLLADLAP